MKNIFLSAFICINFYNVPCYAAPVTAHVCHQDNCVNVEVVSKEADLERGLMYRTNLDEDKGMLFVFAIDDKYKFWMKNTLIDLDMVWISDERKIVHIGANIPKCIADPCPVYAPDQNARYVLEINSGYAANHQWKLGDTLVFKGL